MMLLYKAKAREMAQAHLDKLKIHVKSVVAHLDDEDGIADEDMHRKRLIKLFDKVTVYDAKNDVIRKKLNAKGLRPLERQNLKEDLDKNLLHIVKICRKVRFSKPQIDRMVANLRVYLNEVEQSEETVHRCKKETGLSLAQLEEAWTKMNKSARSGEQASGDLEERTIYTKDLSVAQTALNPGDGGPEVDRFGWTFRIGDRVIQTENDYDKDVFNGDLGIGSAVSNCGGRKGGSADPGMTSSDSSSE